MNTRTFAAVWAAPVAIAAALLAPAAASAQTADSGVYGSAGYAIISPKGAPSDLGAINLRGGYQFNRYLGVEAEGALGVDDGHFTTGTGATAVRGSYGLDWSIGAFGVARYPVSEQLDVFARAGVVHGEFKGKARSGATTVRVSDNDELFAGGAGVQFNFDDKNGIRADYTRYEGDVDADVFGVSYVRKF
ncbi:MAG: porin family protein [Phenylobacterium sp.]|uniref:porin family protein n=1 Tax=Phenylobacterium sp. TaxID=1871053 RepID=UPI001A41AA21|nr:porin family protein [Phenylobacterium sp.]MBL8556512.1 porin family protein [Phenylobacterium sp.]